MKREHDEFRREREAFKRIVQEFDIRKEKARETYTRLYELWSDCEGNLDLQIEALNECMRNRGMGMMGIWHADQEDFEALYGKEMVVRPTK